MRISDWSSDVCSSDLMMGFLPFANEAVFVAGQQLRLCRIFQSHLRGPFKRRKIAQIFGPQIDIGGAWQVPRPPYGFQLLPRQRDLIGDPRSEERRVGNECVSTCRSRRWRSLLKQKKQVMIK